MRRGLSRILLASIILVIIIVAAAGIYIMGRSGSQATSTQTTNTSTTTAGTQTTVTQTTGTSNTTAKARVLVLFDVGGKGDLSFNDMAVLGAEKAKNELGVEVDYQSPSSVDAMPSLLKSASQSGKYDLIIGVGFLWLDPISTVAPQYPNQKYAVIDAAPQTDIPNVAGYIFREQEVASLVGVLAADMAKNINSSCAGAVVGMNIPPLWRFHIGYLYGVQYYNQQTGSNITVSYQYTGTFSDPAVGKQYAQQMISQGCRVLYGLAGLTHVGMFDAVKEANQQGVLALAIGQDASQEWYDPQHIVFSGMKRVDVAVYEAIKSVVDGDFKGGVHSLGLKEGALGISDDAIIKYFATIAQEEGKLPKSLTPDDVVRIVNEQRQKYISSTAWSILQQLENDIKSGKIQFVNPTSIGEYDSIVSQLKAGNLTAALVK